MMTTVPATQQGSGTFKARYESVCAVCSEKIGIGEFIRWNRSKNGEVYHEACHKDGGARAAVPATTGTGNQALDALAAALSPMLTPQIDKTQVLEMVRAEIKNHVSPIVVVEIRTPGNDPKKMECTHQLFPKLLDLIALGRNVYLWGAPGSGKSTAAKQCAEALTLTWGYIALNPQTPESRLIGYFDAKGCYIRTLFRDLYEKGGVFCIDEMDNASAGLVTTLNSGLENGHMAFPDGVIARHKDFVLVATGNTNGKGGNAMFPERRPFDSAFSERFVFLRWEYDTKLEKAITLAMNSKGATWYEWVQEVRKYCEKNFPRLLVSPRASIVGAQLLKGGKFTPGEVAEMLIFKGTDVDTVEKILAARPVSA